MWSRDGSVVSTCTLSRRSLSDWRVLSWEQARSDSAHTHGLDRHLAPAAYLAATATARPCLSRSTRDNRRRPRFPCQSAYSNPHPGDPIPFHLHSQPNQHGCLGSFCALLVPTLHANHLRLSFVPQHLTTLLLPLFCPFAGCAFPTFTTLRNSRWHTIPLAHNDLVASEKDKNRPSSV